MKNNVVAKYFSYQKTEEEAMALTEKIANEINFAIEAKIFFGKIYDQDKIGSCIVKGIFNDKPAVLKTQLLELPVDEVENVKKFNKQNSSKIIRLPKIYLHDAFDRERGYGYIVSEYISYPYIYQNALATAAEKKDFLFFYEEYRNNCLKKYFIPAVEKNNTADFFNERLKKWTKIAKAKNNLTVLALEIKNDFIKIINSGVDFIGFDLQHGHLTQFDIFRGENEYVLLSNLFWAYEPEWYDTTFHLWGGIKSNTDLSITSKKVINYIEDWRQSYHAISVIKKDKMFDKKFMILMMERCVGALLVDLNSQRLNEDREAHLQYLQDLFINIFNYYHQILTSLPER